MYTTYNPGIRAKQTYSRLFLIPDCFNFFEIKFVAKLLRANGGCLGVKRR